VRKSNYLFPSILRRFSRKCIVLGHHGTIVPSAHEIVSKRSFKLSKNEYDWLGNGAYFFQNAPLRAWLWAKREAKRKNSAPAVVEANIYLGECLDLLDVDWVQAVRVYYKEMIEDHMAKGKPMPKQDPPIVLTVPRKDFLIEDMELTYKGKGVGSNKLDREVINFTVQGLFKDDTIVIDSVRSAFSEGHPLYKTSFLYDRSHIQIAVRDIKKCIIGKPRILEGTDLEAQRRAVNNNVLRKLGLACLIALAAV
jgi:hypothetical protein